MRGKGGENSSLNFYYDQISDYGQSLTVTYPLITFVSICLRMNDNQLNLVHLLLKITGPLIEVFLFFIFSLCVFPHYYKMQKKVVVIVLLFCYVCRNIYHKTKATDSSADLISTVVSLSSDNEN